MHKTPFYLLLVKRKFGSLYASIKIRPTDNNFEALEAALKVLEKKSSQVADAGACLWTGRDGKNICVRISPEDCEKIPGAVFIGGDCVDVYGITGAG
jgi:hypothetical protein